MKVRKSLIVALIITLAGALLTVGGSLRTANMNKAARRVWRENINNF